MATTIRDVAEKAGVSPMAVSKVLHGKGDTVRVSKEKALLILRVAKELNYQPNYLARSLRSRKTRTIALVFDHFQRIGDQTGYFNQLFNGAMGAAFEGEYSLTICPRLNSLDGRRLFDGRFDGLVWGKPDVSDDTREAIESATIPVVCLHLPAEVSPPVPVFCCDNRQGLRMGVEHLAKLGHERIAFVIDDVNQNLIEASARWQAFRQALQESGLEACPDAPLIWRHQDGQLARLMSSARRPTALICFSEYLAVSIVRQAEKTGVQIPNDLSIVGYDSTVFCDTSTPRLTAISQPVEQMAHDATQHLISIIEGTKMAPQHFVYPCGLDIRESTARPAHLTVEVIS
jgi:LacI family transcriptional regulator